MRDFNQFPRRMRLQYMYYGENRTRSISYTIESYLELAEIEIAKSKNSLPYNEINAIKELKNTRSQKSIIILNIKYQTKKPFSWILNCVCKGDRFRETFIQLTCELTTSRQKHFSIYISLSATHQGSVKVSSKEKHQTPKKKLLKKLFWWEYQGIQITPSRERLHR